MKKVAVVMGSESDRAVVNTSLEYYEFFGIPEGGFHKQRLLVGEIGVDGGFGDACGLGDFVHADLIVGFGAEYRAGGINDQVFTDLPFLLFQFIEGVSLDHDGSSL